MELLLDGKTYLKFQNSCNKEIFLEELEKLKNEIETNTNFSNFFNICLEKYCILRTSENFFYFMFLSDEEKKIIKKAYTSSEIRLALSFKCPLFLRFENLKSSINNKGISLRRILSFELIMNKKEKKIRYRVQNQTIDLLYIFESDYLIKKIYSFQKKIISRNIDLKDFIKMSYDYFSIDILKAHLEYLSSKNLLARDLRKDLEDNPYKLYVPIAFELLEKAKNKKHLLEMKFKKDKNFKSFNRFNKMSLNNSYSFLKCHKEVMENERAKLFEIEYNDFELAETKRKFYYFFYYFNKKIKNIANIDKEILEDYLEMSFYLKEKINLKIDTLIELRKAHDKISEKYMEKQSKNENEKEKVKVKLKSTNPFLKLKFPKEFKMLKTSEDFFEEGKRNKNCVFSYIQKVNKEECIIYTLTKNEHRYTIEIQKDKEFFLAQMKGFANSEPSEEVREYVIDNIKQNNKRLFKV